MHTQLWHFLLGRRRQHQSRNRRPEQLLSKKTRASKAQVLVIFAFGIFALAAFLGLAMDAASLYLTHARLKRAVDAAAVSAANDIKQGQQVDQLSAAAYEVLLLHDVVIEEDGVYLVDLHVYDCKVDHLDVLAPTFYELCPQGNENPRKLVYVQATQAAPLYFMQLIGFSEIPLTVSSVSEAAPVDLVIVIDTSESMGTATSGGGFDPAACNAANDCHPLKEAKFAASELVDSLYEGYDRIAVVTYDTEAHYHLIFSMDGHQSYLSDNFSYLNSDPLVMPQIPNNVLTTISDIQLHDDPYQRLLWDQWVWRGGDPYTPLGVMVYNPIFPDDRDGDGRDLDYPPNCPAGTTTAPANGSCCVLDEDRWDDTQNPYGWGGVPCDDDTVYDAYDFDDDGVYTANDTTLALSWLAANGSFSVNSTCIGCGIRVASNILRNEGRPNSVWVIVLLSDGIANMTDNPSVNDPAYPDVIPTQYANGFCVDDLNLDHTTDPTWNKYCVDQDLTTRYCVDSNSAECPPEGTPTPLDIHENYYTVYDWTLDMVDAAALTRVDAASDEPIGNEIALYTIGLGSGITKSNDIGEYPGAQLLRYMAAVGDDGDRTTDPCQNADGTFKPPTENCGQYYFAPEGGALKAIFEDIAGRIYTRISQ